MNDVSCRYIPGGQLEGTGFQLNDLWKFEFEERVLLLDRQGHILLMKRELCDSIRNQKISDDLLLKLLQRKLACDMGQTQKCETNDPLEIKPMFFMIDLTNKCNMGCRYCLRSIENDPEEDSISDEMIDAICEYLAQYCSQVEDKRITLQPWGGEPLLEKEKIFLLQDDMKKRGVNPQITIETNSLLLSEKLIEELYRREISIGVSIDGYQEVHDSQRVSRSGIGTHQIVEKRIRNIQKWFEKDISTITTITRNSLEHLEDIIEYLAVDLGVMHIKLNFVHRSCFAMNDDLCLSPEEIGDASLRIFRKILELHKRDIEVYEYNIWLKSMNLLTDKRLDVCYSNGCHGGKRMIAINKNGDIFPCDVTDFPEERLGNISKDRDLIALLEKSAREKPYFKEKKGAECGMCPWWHYCRGGCTVHMKCAAEEQDVDIIECTINRNLYPQLIALILQEPESMNKLLGYEILEKRPLDEYRETTV